jgi:endonuclease YncB( thermonuclease family)
VVDGDSLRLEGRDIRLARIDAPELRQICTRGERPWPCGQAARAALIRLTEGGTVTCRVSGRDRYGRTLAACAAEGADLAAALVSAGWALAYGGYEREEAAARQHRRGL